MTFWDFTFTDAFGVGRAVFSGVAWGRDHWPVSRRMRSPAGGGCAGELLERRRALASAAEAELADELLVAGAMGRWARVDEADELAGRSGGKGEAGIACV